MTESKPGKYIIHNTDKDAKLFHLKNEGDAELGFAISFAIDLKGTVQNSEGVETEKSVNINHPSEDYLISRFVNPYLNAQGDIFKIKVDDDTKTIGYIFPSSALIDDEEQEELAFDEYKQAYKFYCIKNIIEHHEWKDISSSPTIPISELIEQGTCYLVICKAICKQLKLENYFPSLAVYGYYHYPKNTRTSVVSLIETEQNRTELEQIISIRYHNHRTTPSITIKNSKSIINESPLAKLLYHQLLIEGDNALYRFLIIYQLMEHLVDKEFKRGLNDIFEKKDEFTNYKFIQKINELYSTRTTIKKLFSSVNFEGQAEIGNLLRNFLLGYNSDYDKTNIGDCFYDIRNLLFHDYRSVLEKNPDGSLTSLIIQCELLVHHLIVELSLLETLRNSNQLELELI